MFYKGNMAYRGGGKVKLLTKLHRGKRFPHRISARNKRRLEAKEKKESGDDQEN